MNYYGIIENLIVAGIIAFSAWLFAAWRNYQLEKLLDEGVSTNGIGSNYDPETNSATFFFQILNYTNSPIRVKQVQFVTAEGQGGITLKYAKKYGIKNAPLLGMVSQPKFKRLHLSRGFSDEGNIEGDTQLPPKTLGVWEVPQNIISNKKWFIREVHIIIEYPTIFGNSAIYRVNVSSYMLETIREKFTDLVSIARKTEGK